ncbi:hypothetical protein [Okeania sp. SIO2B3]|uniref:hypothetical protein n=1 Tax=Okeania sp. SIO2B3 TaxID=2607784 RepID=UPI0013C23C4C|nr:hypothetical protein [Okeania sp. SIO2B3]NET43289.1 hypothetical protein [Okeania sp. SIO2B3]
MNKYIEVMMDLIKAENIKYLPHLINENFDLNKFIFNVENNAFVESVERVILDYKKNRGDQWKFDIDFEYVLEDEKYTFTIMVTSKLPMFITY